MSLNYIARGAVVSLICGALCQSVLAQQLPLNEGVYLRKDSFCEAFRKGDLDFIDFAVEADGFSYSYPDSSCVVSGVKLIRPSRFLVTGDCKEAGELWQNEFFLDIVSAAEVRLDGVVHRLCTLAVDAPPVTDSQWQGFLEMPVDTLCSFVVVRDTNYYWFDGDESDTRRLEILHPLTAGTVVVLLNSYHDFKLQEGPGAIKVALEYKGYYVPFDYLSYVGDCGPSR